MLQLPELSAVVVPTVPFTEDTRVTVLLASAVPVKVGVVSLVMLSVFELPVSVPSVISGTEGAAGANVSIVMARAGEAGLIFPAVFVAVAVILWLPSVRTLLVMLQLPIKFAVVVPMILPVTDDIRFTVLFACAVPVNVGVLSFVMLSVLEMPVSVPAVMLGVEGAGGTDASIIIARAEDAGLTLPAASVAMTVML